MVTVYLETTIVSDHFPLGYEPHSPALSISFQKLALLHLAKEGVGGYVRISEKSRSNVTSARSSARQTLATSKSGWPTIS